MERTASGTFTDGSFLVVFTATGNTEGSGHQAEDVLHKAAASIYAALLPKIQQYGQQLTRHFGATIETQSISIPVTGMTCRLSVTVKLDYAFDPKYMDLAELIDQFVMVPAEKLITKTFTRETAADPEPDLIDVLFRVVDIGLGGRARQLKDLADLVGNPLDALSGKGPLADIFSTLFGAETDDRKRQTASTGAAGSKDGPPRPGTAGH